MMTEIKSRGEGQASMRGWRVYMNEGGHGILCDASNKVRMTLEVRSGKIVENHNVKNLSTERWIKGPNTRKYPVDSRGEYEAAKVAIVRKHDARYIVLFMHGSLSTGLPKDARQKIQRSVEDLVNTRVPNDVLAEVRSMLTTEEMPANTNTHLARYEGKAGELFAAMIERWGHRPRKVLTPNEPKLN